MMTQQPLSMLQHAGTRPAGIYHFTVGALHCIVISDEGSNSVPPQLYGIDQPVEEVFRILRTHFLSTQKAPVQINVFYTEIAGHNILIDSGFGPLPGPDGRIAFVGKVKTNLQAIGVKREDIDTIIISHFHADHIGGLFDEQGELAFPQAHYYLSRLEWEFWQSSPELSSIHMPRTFTQEQLRVAREMLPRLQSRLTLFEPGQELFPGVTSIAAPGHTPGHTAFTISSQNDTLLLVIDAWVHQNITPEHPEWHFAIDIDPNQGAQTRRSLLEYAANEKLLVLAYHFPWPGLGHIRRTEGHFAWEPTEYRWS